MRYGAAGVPALMQALGEEETWYGAAETLAQLGDTAVQPLLNALNNPRLDNFAVHALTRMGAPAVRPLVEALPTAQPDTQEWIVLLLGLLCAPKEGLDPRLQEIAAQALGERNRRSNTRSKMDEVE